MLSNDRRHPDKPAAGDRQPWETPALTYVGDVGRVLQEGGGKLTPSPSDPGEPRKPKPAQQG